MSNLTSFKITIKDNFVEIAFPPELKLGKDLAQELTDHFRTYQIYSGKYFILRMNNMKSSLNEGREVVSQKDLSCILHLYILALSFKDELITKFFYVFNCPIYPVTVCSSEEELKAILKKLPFLKSYTKEYLEGYNAASVGSTENNYLSARFGKEFTHYSRGYQDFTNGLKLNKTGDNLEIVL